MSSLVIILHHLLPQWWNGGRRDWIKVCWFLWYSFRLQWVWNLQWLQKNQLLRQVYCLRLEFESLFITRSWWALLPASQFSALFDSLRKGPFTQIVLFLFQEVFLKFQFDGQSLEKVWRVSKLCFLCCTTFRNDFLSLCMHAIFVFVSCSFIDVPILFRSQLSIPSLIEMRML